MSMRSAFLSVLGMALVLFAASPAPAQHRPDWSGGVGFLISRPDDERVWGPTVRREQHLTRLVVSRLIASADYIGDSGFHPTFLSVGTDIGVRFEDDGRSVQVALGPTLAYFIAPRQGETICQASCVGVRQGYQAGPRLSATGSLAIGVRVKPQYRLFYEERGHVPFRWGRSGFTGDPNAAFVEIAMGVVLLRP